MNRTHLSKLLFILFLLALSACQPQPTPQPTEEEPIAYIGHGGFFDYDGKQIVLTLEFVDKA